MLLFFFRKTKIAFWVGTFVGEFIAVTTLAPYSFYNINNILGQKNYYYGMWGPNILVTDLKAANVRYVVVFAVVYFAFLICLELIARRIYKRIQDVLLEKCDAHEFLEQHSPLIRKATKTRLFQGHSTTLSILFRNAQGCFETGEIDAALSQLESVPQKYLDMKANWLNRINIYLLLLKLCYLTNNTEGIDRYNRMILDICERKGGAKNIFFKMFYSRLKHNAAGLNQFFKGEYSEALESYLSVPAGARNNYGKSLMHCYLAVIYDGLRMDSQSEAHVKKAIDVGPKLYSVREMQRRLNK